MTENREYIGDGVYASWDGYQIRLATDNPDNPSNVIFLDEYVLGSLYEFFERVSKGD